MRRILTSLIGVMLGVGLARGESAAVDLRPNFVAGRATQYDFWSQREEQTTIRFGEHHQQLTVTYTFEGRIAWTVESVRADGAAECTMTFDWFAFSVAADEEPTRKADSRQGGSDWSQGHDFAKALVGKPLRVRVAADGVIERVDGVEAITSRIDGDEQAKPDETDFKEEAASLAVLWAVPAKLSPGESWRSHPDWNHPLGTLHYQTTSTLHDVGELAGVPVAMIGSESKLSMTFDTPQLPPQAPPMTMALRRGSESEQVVFDLFRHEAVARHMTQTLSMTQTMRLEEGTLSQQREERHVSQILRATEH